MKTGSSYLSQSELPVTFGLGRASAVQHVEIRWPGGRVDSLAAEKANQSLIVQEGTGVIARTALR